MSFGATALATVCCPDRRQPDSMASLKSKTISAMGWAHGSVVHARRVRVLAKLISDLTPRGSRVLDVGSGDGRLASLLAQGRPDLHVEGIDVLVRPDVAVPTSAFDGRTIPFADGAFDVVMIVDVLHHALDCEGLLAEAARVADAFVLIKDHYRDGFAASATLRFMDWVGNRAHGVALPYRYLAAAEWAELFRRRELEVESLHGRLGLYPPPFAWIFERSLHFLAKLRHAPSDS